MSHSYRAVLVGLDLPNMPERHNIQTLQVRGRTEANEGRGGSWVTKLRLAFARWAAVAHGGRGVEREIPRVVENHVILDTS